jgi:hypothetical protein
MIEVDILLKLFDTLKDALKDTHLACQAVLTNQSNIMNYVKALPDSLKEHAKESSDEIDACTKTVEMQSDEILKELRELKGKVKTMILIVAVAFTLFTTAVMIAQLTSLGEDDKHYNLIEKIETLERMIENQKP